MGKNKILEVVPSLQFGGVEQFLYNYLSNMDLTGFEVHILTQEPRYPEAEERFRKLGIKIYAIPPKRKSLRGYFKQIKVILRNEKYNIVHCHLSVKSFWILALAKRARVPVRIYHAHEARMLSGVKKVVYRMYAKLSLRFATDLFACGKESAAFCFGKNSKYALIPNAVLPEKFKFNTKRRSEVRAELSVSDDEILLGDVARFVPSKNHRFLLEVFGELCQRQPNFKLLLIGEGPLESDIWNSIREQGLSRKVVCVGSTDSPEKYYSAMDVFCAASIYEGFPVTVVEAQCSGLTMVLSDRITREVKIADGCHFVSIKNQETWVRVILGIVKKMKMEQNDRMVGYEQVANSEFNVRNSAGTLAQRYRLLWESIAVGRQTDEKTAKK